MEITKVAAGVITKEAQVLITRRAEKEDFAGGWEFPGGKIEPTETEAECLVRELKEELDINVNVGDYCATVHHDYGSICVCLVAYYCTIENGTISMSVHDQYRWVNIEDLLSYDLLPADIPIAKQVMADYS